MDECIHGLGPVSACSICNGNDRKRAAESADAWRYFDAKYPGHCHGCNLPISVGQIIAWKAGELPTHEGCE